MKGAITSRENRAAGNILLFDVNERTYNPDAPRVVTRHQALDGSTLTTDWGFDESSRQITIDNVYLSREVYNALQEIKEDNDSVFEFHYRNSSWQVVVEIVNGTPNGDKIDTSMKFTVVSKIADGETS
jgi:hypothetical protein